MDNENESMEEALDNENKGFRPLFDELIDYTTYSRILRIL